jgi:hypothetical protein
MPAAAASEPNPMYGKFTVGPDLKTTAGVDHKARGIFNFLGCANPRKN